MLRGLLPAQGAQGVVLRRGEHGGRRLDVRVAHRLGAQAARAAVRELHVVVDLPVRDDEEVAVVHRVERAREPAREGRPARGAASWMQAMLRVGDRRKIAGGCHSEVARLEDGVGDLVSRTSRSRIHVSDQRGFVD